MTPRQRALFTLLAWAVLTAFVVLAFRSIEWAEAFDALRRVRGGWMLLAVALNAAILFAWAVLWRLLVPRRQPVSYWRMLEVTAMASAAMNSLPALAGHATGVALLEGHAGVGRAAALSVVALDQLGEGLAKVAMFLLIGMLVPMPDWIRPGFLAGAAAVLAFFAGLLWAAHRHKDGDPDERPRSDATMDRLRAFAARWARGLEALRSWRLSLGAFGVVLLMKLAEGLGIVAAQHAFGVEISAATTVLVLGSLSLATMVPLTPGNVGTYEASVFLAYRYMGVPAEQALPLAIVQHVAFLVPAVGIGYVILMARGIGWSGISGSPQAAERGAQEPS